MKKKSRKLKKLFLHGEVIESSFNELEMLEARHDSYPKSLHIQVLDALASKPTHIKRKSS